MNDNTRSGAGDPDTTEPEFLQHHDFEPHVGKIFRFKGTPYAFPLDRIILDQQPLPSWMKRHPFILIFQSPKGEGILPEGFYEAEVEGGPTFGIYVAPIQTPEPDRQQYQAVFN